MASEHRFPTSAPEREGPEPPLSDLVRRLGDDGARLVRQEISLAKLELQAKMARFTRDLIGLSIAGALAGLGALALTATLILVLGRYVFGGEYWVGALIVGGMFLIVGGIWALAAARGMGKNVQPEATVESVRENVDWAKREARDFKRGAL